MKNKSEKFFNKNSAPEKLGKKFKHRKYKIKKQKKKTFFYQKNPKKYFTV